MTTKTQAIFNAKCDEDVTEDNPFKFIPKTEILEDMKNRAAICDFHPFKAQITVRCFSLSYNFSLCAFEGLVT